MVILEGEQLRNLFVRLPRMNYQRDSMKGVKKGVKITLLLQGCNETFRNLNVISHELNNDTSGGFADLSYSKPDEANRLFDILESSPSN